MTPELSPLLAWSLGAASWMLAGALLMAALRLLRGPSVFDRVVAIDFMATIAIALIALRVLGTGQTELLGPAAALALLAFLGTVAIARYMKDDGA